MNHSGMVPVPGRSAPLEVPDDVVHLRTFGTALGAAFLLSMLLPFVPWAVVVVAAGNTVWGMGRTVQPSWRSVPFTRWRIAFSPLDGMLWTGMMSMLLFLAIGVALGGRP